MKYQHWVFIGNVLAALYVALAAFGAHGLESKLEEKDLATYHTALRYLIIHAFGFIIVNFISEQKQKNCGIVNLFFSIGLIFFTGGLLMHSLRHLMGMDMNVFAMVAPLGGLSFIAGWLSFAFILRKK